MARSSRAIAQSADPHFAFHTLGWSQFELLCHTVISDVLGQTIEIYEPSNDRGQDALYLGSSTEQLGLPPGPTVFQIKYIRTPNEALRLSALQKDITKARALWDDGVAKNYVLITNGALSGETVAAARRRLDAFGMHSHFFGRRWLTRIIRESSRLRQLVPRIYGLGDLHEIIDQRAYRQTDAERWLR